MMPLLFAKALFYVYLAANILQYRKDSICGAAFDPLLLRGVALLGGSTCDTYQAWLDANLKRVWPMQGPVVFISILAAQLLVEENALQYLFGTILIWVLWEGGRVHSTQPHHAIFINSHHVGAIIAFVHQPGEESRRAWRNAIFFSWLWLIHSLSFLQDVMLPLLGLPKLGEGGKYFLMDIVRYIYATVGVCFFYELVMGDGQPGFGWNYQTAALLTMVGGRWLFLNNFLKIHWMRNAEFPGFVLVALGHLVHN